MTSIETGDQPKAALREISENELKRHDKCDDLWLAFEGKVSGCA